MFYFMHLVEMCVEMIIKLMWRTEKLQCVIWYCVPRAQSTYFSFETCFKCLMYPTRWSAARDEFCGRSARWWASDPSPCAPGSLDISLGRGTSATSSAAAELLRFLSGWWRQSTWEMWGFSGRFRLSNVKLSKGSSTYDVYLSLIKDQNNDKHWARNWESKKNDATCDNPDERPTVVPLEADNLLNSLSLEDSWMA